MEEKMSSPPQDEIAAFLCSLSRIFNLVCEKTHFNVLHFGHRDIRKKAHKRRINKATTTNSAILTSNLDT
jgi:hypothetical protein